MSAWLSISDLVIVLGWVVALSVRLGLYVLAIRLGPVLIELTWDFRPVSASHNCPPVRLARFALAYAPEPKPDPLDATAASSARPCGSSTTCASVLAATAATLRFLPPSFAAVLASRTCCLTSGVNLFHSSVVKLLVRSPMSTPLHCLPPRF